MSISAVQWQSLGTGTSGAFTSACTPGNTLFLWILAYASGGNTISSSAPKYNGASVTGAAELFSVNSPTAGGGSVYTAIWMLPAITGSSTAVSYTLANGTSDSNTGFFGGEFSGLGASPSADSGASPNPATATGSSGNPASGSTGNITASPELILGASIIYGQTMTSPGSPWNTLQAGSAFDSAGYQIVTGSGGAYDFSPVRSTSAGWCAGVVAVTPSAAFTASPNRPRGQAVNRASTW